jgi:hypothetical protein
LLERGWLQLQADIDLVEIAFRAASKALLKSAKSAARKRPRRSRQARSVA